MKAQVLRLLRVGGEMLRHALTAPSLAAFYDSLAPRYDALIGDVQRRRAASVVNLLQREISRPLERALDLGAGTGILTGELTKIAACVIGVDLSLGMLRRARSGTHGDSGLRYVAGSFFALPFADRSFDLVAGLGIMSHVRRSELEIFLKEIERVVREEGLVALAFTSYPWRLFSADRAIVNPNFWDRLLALAYNTVQMILNLRERRRHTDPALASEALRRAGFSVEIIQTNALAMVEARTRQDKVLGTSSAI